MADRDRVVERLLDRILRLEKRIERMERRANNRRGSIGSGGLRVYEDGMIYVEHPGDMRFTTNVGITYSIWDLIDSIDNSTTPTSTTPPNTGGWTGRTAHG